MVSEQAASESLPKISEAWPDFTRRLGAVLAGLEEDQYLILAAKDSNRYVQFAAQGSYGMRAETTSNGYLDGKERLDDSQVAALIECGWHAPTIDPREKTPRRDPDGSPNFFLDYPVPIPYDKVATLAVRTLAEVLSIPHPGSLVYDALDRSGNTFSLPELGLKERPTPDEEERKTVEGLLSTLKETTALNDLEYDGDGDIGIRCGNAQLYVRPVKGGRIRMHGLILENVQENLALLRRLNELNAGDAPMRLSVSNGRIYGQAEVPGVPFVSRVVSAAFVQFSQAADEIGSLLQGEGLGRTAYGEPEATRPIMTEHGDDGIQQSIRLNDTVATIHHLPSVKDDRIHSRCEYVVRPGHIPFAVNSLKDAGKEDSWVVFMFKTPVLSAETDDQFLNLQYSIADGRVGLEWVLLGPRNIADQKALTSFIKRRGHKVERRELNGVRFLRVEDDRIIKLGTEIVQEFYGMPEDATMGLLADGFSLPPISLSDLH